MSAYCVLQIASQKIASEIQEFPEFSRINKFPEIYTFSGFPEL